MRCMAEWYPAVSSDVLQQLDLFSQYAAASYCTNNVNSNSTGAKLTCAVGNCASVEKADTKTLYEFSKYNPSAAPPIQTQALIYKQHWRLWRHRRLPCCGHHEQALGCLLSRLSKRRQLDRRRRLPARERRPLQRLLGAQRVLGVMAGSGECVTGKAQVCYRWVFGVYGGFHGA